MDGCCWFSGLVSIGNVSAQRLLVFKFVDKVFTSTEDTFEVKLWKCK
jgi:hypothetical protein